jgi:hypothetical protein
MGRHMRVLGNRRSGAAQLLTAGRRPDHER